jgi:hypothetical protein
MDILLLTGATPVGYSGSHSAASSNRWGHVLDMDVGVRPLTRRMMSTKGR